MSARDDILQALARARAPAPPSLPAVYRSPGETDLATPAGRRSRFAAMLLRVGAQVTVVGDPAAAAAVVQDLLGRHGARSLLLSDAPLVARVAAALPPTVERVPHDAPRQTQLACDAGLTTAQWGIAETGTLVLQSAAERHRLASLLPGLHIALLPAERLLGSLGEALARQAEGGAGAGSRTITFVTGPSRTADIELELVVGVHGPERLHVVLVESV